MRRVGILLDRKVYNQLKEQRVPAGNERIRLYNRASRKLGLKPFYMTMGAIRRSHAKGLVREGNLYRVRHQSIPSVIHNRMLVTKRSVNRRLERLASRTQLFNPQNRYSKYRIHRLLTQHQANSYRLPYTTRLTRDNLERAIRDKRSLYLKPLSGSIGNGIIRVTYQGDQQWKVQWGIRRVMTCSSRNVCRLALKLTANKRYLLQEEIALCRYNGRPYDLRVSVQRGGDGRWQVTGMFGKVAARGRHVTNVAKGGKVKQTNTLFRASGFDPAQMERVVSHAALHIADYLGRKLPGLADIGLDLGVDRFGHIYFIEMNGRDQRIGFRKAGMQQTFYKSYENPLRYARYLLDRGRSNGHMNPES